MRGIGPSLLRFVTETMREALENGVRHRRNVVAVLAAGLAVLFPCTAISASPAAASPATSSVLCQTLHQAVQPALVGVMKNDNLLEQASRAFMSGGNDRVALSNVTEALVANLNLVARLLAQQFPQDANPVTSASEGLMKSRLQAVASAQSDALNVIEEYQQAEELSRPREGGVFTPDRGTPSDFHSATASKDPARPIVDTPVGSPGRYLQIARSQIGELEDSAGIAIMNAVKVCNSTIKE